jgi:hypothetical protein
VPGGRKITKSFSVRKLGYRVAFSNAVSARRKMLAMVEDRLYIYNRIAKKFAKRLRNRASND